MSSKSKNGKKSVKSELSKDLTSFKAVTSTLKSLDENSNVVSVTKCLTRLLHYLRRIEQDDFERRDALTQAIALIGESWLRESTDNNIKIATACAIVQSFRLFVPDFPPFCNDEDGENSSEIIFEVLTFLLEQIPLVNDEEVKDKAWYMVEYIAELKLFNCVFELDDEPTEAENHHNVLLEKLFKATIESASNIHTNEQQKYLINIIGDILVDGEIEDFLLIDHLLHYFIPSNMKLNPAAANIVRGALQKCSEKEFGLTLQSFLNTLFLEHDKMGCRVANKWTDVVLETFITKPELIYPSFPVIEERMDQATVKPTERMKAAGLLADFIIKGDDDILVKRPQIWQTLQKAVEDEDARVREAIIRFCGQIAIKKPSFMARIDQVLIDLHLDKRDTVRERVTDVILEIANHKFELLSEKIWSTVAILALDRKERVRTGAIRTIIDTYCKYSTNNDDITVEMKNKINDLKISLLHIYLKADTVTSDLSDVQKGIELAFQKQLLGGRHVDPERRAKILIDIWLNDNKGRTAVDSIFKTGYSLRKLIIEITDLAKETNVDDVEQMETLRTQSNQFKRFMKNGDRNFTTDNVLDIFVRVLVEEAPICELFRKITFMEVGLRPRHRSFKELAKLLYDLPVSHVSTSSAWLPHMHFLCDRIFDHCMEPSLIVKLLEQLHAPSNDKPEKIADLLVLLAQTHEYGFANDEVFTGLHKVLTNDSFSVVMKSSILEILSTVGYVLDEVIELKAQESGTADTSIAKTLCNTIRFQCKTPHIKLAIKALQSIGRGDTYCRNFSQPIVGQISNTAARTIKEGIHNAIFDSRFDDALRMIGICYSAVADFSGHFSRIFEDYILTRSHKFPPSTCCAVIKCCERYLCSAAAQQPGQCTTSKLIDYISNLLSVDNSIVTSTASKAILRVSVHKSHRSLISRTVIRKTAFQMVAMPKKIIKYLKQIKLPVQWISVLAVIPTEMDKSFIADMEAICRQYRATLNKRSDPFLYEPESSLPYIIDLLAQTFTLQDLNSSNEVTVGKLLDIRDRLRMIVACFTSTRSYGLQHQDRDRTTKAIGKSYGLIFGIADVCRKYLFAAEDLRLSRKLWVIAELIKQEVVSQSAKSGMCVDPYELKKVLALFPKDLYKVIVKDHKLTVSEVRELIPADLIYQPITPTKLKKETPRAKTAKKFTKLNINESSSEDEAPKSDDDESNSDNETNDLQTTRSGRSVKKRVIEGTKQSEKLKERTSTDSVSDNLTTTESEGEKENAIHKNITQRRKRQRLSVSDSPSSDSVLKAKVARKLSPAKPSPKKSPATATKPTPQIAASPKLSVKAKRNTSPGSSRSSTPSRPSTPKGRTTQTAKKATEIRTRSGRRSGRQ